LNPKAKRLIGVDRDTKIEALIQLIPYVGGSLSTLYFGEKQRKRFERLEVFYKELGEELEKVKSSIASIDLHSEDELASLIEEINERVENERIDSKRKYYKNLFKKSLIHPVKNNFNERKYFLDLISQFTELHFQIISKIALNQKKIPIDEISIPGVDHSLIKGFIQQLNIYGILEFETTRVSVMKGSSGIRNYGIVGLTELGRRFHYYCMIQ
jgi:hypothetical protein